MNKPSSFSLLAVVASVILFGAGCSYAVPADNSTPIKAPATDNSASAETISVSIKNFSFQPNGLTIKSGTTVTWTNNDSAPHTVTANDGSFDSGTMSTGDTFSYTFTKPGVVDYVCTFHKSMRGSLTITE